MDGFRLVGWTFHVALCATLAVLGLALVALGSRDGNVELIGKLMIISAPCLLVYRLVTRDRS